MNTNLNEAVFDCQKADALMYAIEAAYLCRNCEDSDLEYRHRAECAFYALWDAIHKVQQDLELLERMNAASGDNQ